MSYKSSGRRPRGGSMLFIFVLLGLIVLIVVQLIGLSARDAQRGSESSESQITTQETSTSDSTETEATESGLDPNRIIMDFSAILPPAANEYLRTWPSESSVEPLRDASALIQSLKGRAYGPGALEGVTVILDPGHGGIDGGTAFPLNPPHEIIEKDVVLKISTQAKAELEALGAEVIMTRTTDEFNSVYVRAAKAGEIVIDRLIEELESSEKTLDPLLEYEQLFERIYELNIDMGGGEFMGGGGATEQARLLYDLGKQFPEIIFVSVHLNSFADDPRIGGLQVFYVDNPFQFAFTKSQTSKGDILPPVYQSFNDENRLRLATSFSNAILSAVPEMQTVGGPATLKQEGFVVLNRTGLESVMLELGFVTNPQDRANLLDPVFQSRLSESISRGVYDYFSGP